MIQEPKITSIYTDAIDVSYNMYNVTLKIQSIEEKNIPALLGNIKMSPQTLKALIPVLQRNLEGYESIYGEIPSYTEEVKEKERKAYEVLEQRQEEERRKLEELELQNIKK